MKRYFFALLMIFAVLPGANAQVAPGLTWITNSSLKLEQVIGDIDWAANAQSSNAIGLQPKIVVCSLRTVGRIIKVIRHWRARESMFQLSAKRSQ